MKIAYIGTKGLPSKGGTERVVEAIVQRLAGKHDIVVYCDSKYTPAGTIIPEIRLIRVPSVPGKYAHPMVLYLLCALHAVFFGNYDLIHMHGVDACFTLPLLRLRYKVIATSHGSPSRILREKWGDLAWFFFKRTEYPFCYLSNIATSVSNPDAQFYESRYHKKVVYVPNGVDENLIYDLDAACAMLDQHGVQPGNYLLFAAGRIDPSKGCHLALEAHAELRREIPLLVVGDLEQIPVYGTALRQMATGHPVRFIPLITDKKLLYGIVKLCRMFIFPSIGEGMSMMLLEAASLGVPIICSDIPENRAAMQEHALYFQSGDSPDLKNQIQWAFDHYPQMKETALRARDTLRQCFSWEEIIKQYEHLYQLCFTGKAARPTYTY